MTHGRPACACTQKWKEHRSTDRYVRHMGSMLSSRMVRGLAPPLLYIFGVAAFVCAYNTAVQLGVFPYALPELKMSNNGARCAAAAAARPPLAAPPARCRRAPCCARRRGTPHPFRALPPPHSPRVLPPLAARPQAPLG